MKRLVRLSWPGCLLAGSLLLQGQGVTPGLPVRRIEIRHVYPPAVSDDLIRANIRMKEGDPFTPLGTQGDVRNLQATGYFYNVRVATEPAESVTKWSKRPKRRPNPPEVGAKLDCQRTLSISAIAKSFTDYLKASMMILLNSRFSIRSHIPPVLQSPQVTRHALS